MILCISLVAGKHYGYQNLQTVPDSSYHTWKNPRPLYFPVHCNKTSCFSQQKWEPNRVYEDVGRTGLGICAFSHSIYIFLSHLSYSQIFILWSTSGRAYFNLDLRISKTRSCIFFYVFFLYHGSYTFRSGKVSHLLII